MAASDWANVSIASAAFVVSAATAWTSYRHRQEDVRRADVTAYFHWLTEFAKIKLLMARSLKPGTTWSYGIEVLHQRSTWALPCAMTRVTN